MFKVGDEVIFKGYNDDNYKILIGEKGIIMDYFNSVDGSYSCYVYFGDKYNNGDYEDLCFKADYESEEGYNWVYCEERELKLYSDKKQDFIKLIIKKGKQKNS